MIRGDSPALALSFLFRPGSKGYSNNFSLFFPRLCFLFSACTLKNEGAAILAQWIRTNPLLESLDIQSIFDYISLCSLP
jgi:hypothetical protein